jgi:hypothetical protein
MTDAYGMKEGKTSGRIFGTLNIERIMSAEKPNMIKSQQGYSENRIEHTWTTFKSRKVMQLGRRLLTWWSTPEPQIHELAGCIRVQNPNYVRLTKCATYET